MNVKNYLFEERVTTINQSNQMDNFPITQYIESCKNGTWLELEKNGAKVICQELMLLISDYYSCSIPLEIKRGQVGRLINAVETFIKKIK